MSRAVAALAVLTLGFVVESRVYAEDGDVAHRLYLDADFRGAQSAFEAVLESPDLNRATASAAHVHLAALASMFDDEERARAHAAAALALDPNASAPEGAPAGFANLLAEIAASQEGRGATIDLERVDQHHIRARLSPPLRLLAADLVIDCTTEGGELLAEAEGPSPMVVMTLPTGIVGELHCRAGARSSGGAALFDGSPLVFEADMAAGTQSANLQGRGRRLLWLWIGLGALVVVAALVTVLAVTLADDRVVLGHTTIEGW